MAKSVCSVDRLASVGQKRGYIKCNKCQRQKGSHLFRRELRIILGFYQQQPAYRLASDLGINYKTVTRIISVFEKRFIMSANWKAESSKEKSNWTKRILVVVVKANEDAAQPEKASFLGFWSPMDRSIQSC